MVSFVALIAAVAASVVPVALAQDNVPIYVPFEWDQLPLTATVIGQSPGTTTYALIDGGRRATPGPATLVQGPSGASMFYVNPGAPTPTLSGVCNLSSPVAMCTLNVHEVGAVVTPSGTPIATAKTGSSAAGNKSGAAGSAGTSTAFLLSATTLAMGFCIGLAMLS